MKENTIQMLSETEKDILFHTLGLNYNDVPNRNFFGTGTNSTDYLVLEGLVKKDIMLRFEKISKIIPEDEIVYQIKSDLIPEIITYKNSLKPKLTRSQKRYQLYLQSETTESFIEFLKNPYWNDYRKRNGV